MVLSIVVTWCGVDEPTSKTLLFSQKKKKENRYDLYTLFDNFSIHNIFIIPYDIWHLQNHEMAKFNCLTKHMYKAHF